PIQGDTHGRMEHEIRAVVTGGEQAGLLKERDVEMITSIVEFKEEEVTKIMIPRTKMVAIEESTPLEEAIQIIQETRFSRYPIYEQSRDKIVGILYTKDLFQYWKKDQTPPLNQMMRKAFFVPESKRIRDLLNDFIKRRQLIAVVLDEFGGTTGIVSLKDILGRIFGESVGEEVSPHSDIIDPDSSNPIF
ncbi:MAG: CBS domain-containing protein, partial [Planctomycetota bacterium]